ncbi:MAG: response regulator [Ardenticatenaceae bacterium]|nr:response regulator [Ardenticatenaceae bacterium]MCB8947096.1 response regulator [Ardenticatenaceae bacterium]
MPGILIVDDMPLIRSALVKILSRQNDLFSPVWEATNGEEAVALARLHKPDLILMDIKMPALTGLQATAVIRQEQPDVKIVMLTAYNEFSYVQKALKLGARDYILKPVRPDKLLELLTEIKEEIQNERRDLRTVEIVKDSLQKTLPVIEANLVENLIRGINPEGTTVEESLAYLGKRLVWPVVMVAKIDSFDQFSQGESAEELQRVYTGLVKMVREMLPEPQRALVGYSSPGRVVTIISAEQSLTTTEKLREFGEKLRQAIATNMPFTVTIGLGKRRMELDSIPLSYAEANLARRYLRHLQNNRVVSIDDVEDEAPGESGTSRYLVQRERLLVKAVQMNHKQDAQQLTNEIVDFLSQRYYTRPEAMKNHCAELVTLVAWGVIGDGSDEPTILNVLHEQVRALASWKTISEIRAWTLNSLAEMMTLVQGLSQRQDVMQTAVSYISKNYHRSDLSLAEVADAVSLSQSHFSSQFKAKVGLSYVKFLTSVRLDEAKKLLCTSDHSVTSIAEMVGYPNATNFYRHFQRDTGTTPAAYRETASR